MPNIGFWATAGASSGAAGSYELIESKILAATATSVTFTAIPQTYKHLQVRLAMQFTAASNTGTALLRFNSDAATNYSYHNLTGNGTSVVSGGGSYTSAGLINGNGTTPGASVFTGAIIDILDYVSTTKNKTARFLGGRAQATSPEIYLGSGAWYSTAAITSITLPILSGTAFSIGSRFSLYGVKA